MDQGTQACTDQQQLDMCLCMDCMDPDNSSAYMDHLQGSRVYTLACKGHMDWAASRKACMDQLGDISQGNR